MDEPIQLIQPQFGGSALQRPTVAMSLSSAQPRPLWLYYAAADARFHTSPLCTGPTLLIRRFIYLFSGLFSESWKSNEPNSVKGARGWCVSWRRRLNRRRWRRGSSVFWKQIPMKSSVQRQRGGLEERVKSKWLWGEGGGAPPTTTTTILLSKLLQPQLIPLWPSFHWAQGLHCANEAIQLPVTSWWQP